MSRPSRRHKAPTVRRSARLNPQKGPASTMVVEIEEAPRMKKSRLWRAERRSSSLRPPCEEATSSGTAMGPNPVNSTVRVHKPRSSASSLLLDKREKAVTEREAELRAKMAVVEERLLHVRKKEEELVYRRVEAILSYLEPEFTCPICCEILSCPYTLTPSRCGHTFCAICILKWFLSRIHQACGGWHEAVDCPICRALLILTPPLPRSDITFPFTPNRALDSFLKSEIEKLRRDHVTKEVSDVVKPENFFGRNLKRDEGMSTSGIVTNWRDNGTSREDWLKRDREGRTEMRNIATNWEALRPQDFLQIKMRLGI